MAPNAPAAAPSTTNTNLPFGGQSQASSDASLGSNILSFLPTQEQQTAKVNPSDTSILPTVNPVFSTFTAPTAPTINPNQYSGNLTGYNTAVQGAEKSLTGSENNAYQQALNEYQSNISQFGDLTGVYNKLATQYGLPGYQQDVNSLQGLLENLNQDINARTTLGGGLMTESARDEAYANAENPINIALSNASREYETGQTNVNNLLGAYETSLTNELKPEELNLQNLPTLFQQTNEAAQAGYTQGGTALEDTIQNRIQQQQADAFAKEVNAQYGNLGGAGATGLSGALSTGAPVNGQFQGVSFKDPTQKGMGGYNFTINGKPASAVTWAAQNGQPPSQVIQFMAQNGDATAGQAYQALLSNPNMSLQELEQMFPAIAWGASQQPSAPKPQTPAQIGQQNMKQLMPAQGSNIGSMLLDQLTHPQYWI
jgi:hypothetical protein